MYCISCGKQIADNARFCKYCGTPNPQNDELAELVAAARIGGQDAISALYEKTYSKVYYTVKSMIKDDDTVFDIVQDTYIKAFAHLDSFQGDTKFLPWVRQIAANTTRDWLKKKRPMLFTDLNSGDGQDTPVEELFPDERSENLPDQVIDQEETKRLIREIIEELPEDQRAAIGMFYYEEMSVKEIAAAMDVSESAVKSRLMYGRNKIEKKVRELEKQGTKLYSLSPIPFLLLLFRSQEAYAAEVPDIRILRDILASQPVGTATAATAAGAAKGTGTAGGIGALKIGLIAFATVTVAGLGAFGVTRLIAHPTGNQESAAIEDNIDQEELESPEESAPIEQEEVETPEESSPIDEALEQYRIIISQADSYDYNTDIPDLETVGYRYALVQMQPDDPVPTLLLQKEEGGWSFVLSTRVFQYDTETKTVRQPTEVIGGGIRGGISMAGDGHGIFDQYWSGGTGEGSVERITLDGDSLNWDTYWTGRIDLMPDSITFIEIEWHEIGDLSALDGWTATDSGEAEPETQAENENESLLAGYAGTYTPYDDFHDMYGGGERLRDIILMESGMVTGGGTSWSVIDENGLEPSEIIQNEDGSIEITFSGWESVYKVYPAGVVPEDSDTFHYSSDDFWQRELDLGKVHILYQSYDRGGGVMEILYHN